MSSCAPLAHTVMWWMPLTGDMVSTSARIIAQILSGLDHVGEMSFHLNLARLKTEAFVTGRFRRC